LNRNNDSRSYQKSNDRGAVSTQIKTEISMIIDDSILYEPSGLIDRQPIIYAIRTAMNGLVEDGHSLEMTAICGMGLVFLLTGEDGYYADDDTARLWGIHPTALQTDLFNDLDECWQGLHGEDLQEGQEIIEAIVGAYRQAWGSQ
jgi:hypothetical protein